MAEPNTTALRTGLCVCTLAAVVGCGNGKSSGSGFNPTSGTKDASASSGDANAMSFGDGSSSEFPDSSSVDASTNAADGGCPVSALMVYVTGQPADLWSFWPPTFTFTKIGTLSCTDSPTHMTVDRLGNAWVVADGNVYKTSTTDATCSLVPTWQPQAGFDDFAVSLVGLTNTDSTLYLLGTSDLAHFDIMSGTFQIVGAPNVTSTSGDMTSNGMGNLYFLEAYTAPHPLYEINPSNAAIAQTYNVNAPGVQSQALAYFGGRFYAFEDNIVYAYDAATNSVQMLGQAPLSVTGAGQSTCVPQTPQTGPPPS